MNRTYKKSASYIHPTDLSRHTNCRKLRKRLDRRDRRRLNRLALTA